MEGETVIAGVDTHKDVHVLCLLDGLGRKIWSGSFGADPEGYDRLAEAIGDPGSCMVVGVEGTASYGAGLTRRLVELGYNVVEVLRPKRDKVRPGCYRYSEIGQARQRPTAIRATANYPTASPAAPPSRAGIRFH